MAKSKCAEVMAKVRKGKKLTRKEKETLKRCQRRGRK